jgi:hypothetical protein
MRTNLNKDMMDDGEREKEFENGARTDLGKGKRNLVRE